MLLWLVSLPVAWDVIQLFCGLSFFGWLGFIRLNDDEIRRVPEAKREKARDNLRLLSNYFFVSFGFYVICAIADYLIHNNTLLGDFFNVERATPILILTVGTTGVFGLVLLVTPMAVARGIGQRGRGLGDISPPPIGLVLSSTVPASINIIILLYLLPHLNSLMYGGQLLLATNAVSWLGTYLNWKYWESGRLTSLLGILQHAGPISFVIAVILNLPLFYTSTFIVTSVVTITTTTT
jgi:hypothetical protein